MPSNISTTSINVNYPVSGQNNSSQGFRDNFSAIKTALDSAALELTELQKISQSVLLREPVPSLPALNNDMSYNFLSRPLLRSYAETFYDNGTVGNFVTLDFQRGNFQKITTTTDVSVTLTNFPRAEYSARMLLWVTTGNFGHRIYFSDRIISGAMSKFISNRTILFPGVGSYLIEIRSVDQGQQYWVSNVEGLVETGSESGSSGNIITVNADYPTATTTQLGMVRVDGTTIGINNGTISVIGGVPSDAAIKYNIETIESPLELVDKLRGVSYNLRDTARRSLGVVAQELETVLPELVESGPDGVKRVHYANMAGLFIECIKKLNEEISELKSQVAALTNAK